MTSASVRAAAGYAGTGAAAASHCPVPGWHTLVGTSTPSHRPKQSPQARCPGSTVGPSTNSQHQASHAPFAASTLEWACLSAQCRLLLAHSPRSPPGARPDARPDCDCFMMNTDWVQDARSLCTVSLPWPRSFELQVPWRSILPLHVIRGPGDNFIQDCDWLTLSQDCEAS